MAFLFHRVQTQTAAALSPRRAARVFDVAVFDTRTYLENRFGCRSNARARTKIVQSWARVRFPFLHGETLQVAETSATTKELRVRALRFLRKRPERSRARPVNAMFSIRAIDLAPSEALSSRARWLIVREATPVREKSTQRLMHTVA